MMPSLAPGAGSLANLRLAPEPSGGVGPAGDAPAGGVAFGPDAPHRRRPRLRPVRGMPAQAKAPDGTVHQMLALTDARQISDKVVMTQVATQLVLPLMDGSRDVETIVAEVGRGLTVDILHQIVAQLDDGGLLEGPAFDAILARVRADFDATDVLPPGSTAIFAESLVRRNQDGSPAEDELPPDEQARRVAQVFDDFIDKALAAQPEPELTTLPKAIVAPHLDYGRGGSNYAGVYGRLRGLPRPDRVIILGTNHFGQSTGVCACNKGYQTVLGVCPLDRAAADLLGAELGEAVFADRYDHEREHSIELHIPWIQHVFGRGDDGQFPAVLGVLVHDPAVKNGESYDGQGVALQPFVEALKKILAALPGRTLLVSSADLSHCGPAFGDRVKLLGDEAAAVEARNRVLNHDREMLQMVVENRPWDLVSSMAWQQNPTRWCSTGNLVATMLAAQPSVVRLINYVAAVDPQGQALVSSVAMTME